MHDNATNRTIPRTAHTITPHLVVRGAAQAADWYQQAFGAQVGATIPVPGGKFIQIELLLGDLVVMVADEFPDMGVLSPLSLGGTYGALHITTDNADALWERAVAAPSPPEPRSTGRSQGIVVTSGSGFTVGDDQRLDEALHLV
jgi:uncharacterized glyoxalase superfamily protein PhnB